MRHFAVLNIFALGRLFGSGGSFGCSTTFSPAPGECPCDASEDCDRNPGEGCGCGATDNKGGGCDNSKGGVIWSCDEDMCQHGNDKCKTQNIVQGMDAPCKTQDKCVIDWSSCKIHPTGGGSGNDNCGFDNPCGCGDTAGQPTEFIGTDNICGING